MLAVQEWSVEDVQGWLQNNGFGAYSDKLCGQHNVDGNALLMLQEEDLRAEIIMLGDRKRLLMSIHKLRSESPSLHNKFAVCDHIKLQKPPLAKRLDSECSAHSDEFEAHNTGERPKAVKLKPEYTELLMSFVYMFAVFLLTSFVMVIVHDRVPDMKKYPPLPDIVLDNMPYVPWAFEMCELTGIVLLTAWSITLFFHKHRLFLFLTHHFTLTTNFKTIVY